MQYSNSTFEKSIRADACPRGCTIGEVSLFKIDSNWEIRRDNSGSGTLETIKDRRTGLIWTRNFYRGNVSKTLSELRQGTSNPHWRLPTYDEMTILYNNLPLRPRAGWTGAKGKNRTSPPFYWPDKAYANNREYVSVDRVKAPREKWQLKYGYRTLNFIYNRTNYVAGNSKGYYRPVRPDGDSQTSYPIMSDPLVNIFKAIPVLTGDASQRQTVWPFQLTITHFDKTTGEWSGQIEWETLNAVHHVKGSLSGNQVVFYESEVIKKGNAGLGCIYTLFLDDAGTQFAGKWEDCRMRLGSGDVTIRLPSQ